MLGISDQYRNRYFGLALLMALYMSGVQAASLTQRRCVVDSIKVQDDFDVNQFTGYWYDVQRLDVRHSSFHLSSATSLYTLQPDGYLQIAYGGNSESSCSEPLIATGFPLHNPAKWHVMFDDYPAAFLRGAFWVIETDYARYALVYGCNKMKADGTCRRNHELVYVLSRTRYLDDGIQRRLDYIIEYYLCVDPASVKSVQHDMDCPPSPTYNWDEWSMMADEAAPEADDNAVQQGEPEPFFQQCQITDVKVAEGFTLERWLGQWYFLASTRAEAPSVDAPVMLSRLNEQGAIESFFTKSTDGHCSPTLYRVMQEEGPGVFTMLYRQDDRPFTVTYLSEDDQFAVIFRCLQHGADGACAEPVVDVLGRSASVPEQHTDAIKAVISNLCHDPADFHKFAFETVCEIDVGDSEPSCLVADVTSAPNLDMAGMAGSWYTLSTLQAKSPPSLSWYNTLNGNASVTSWLTYASNMKCEQPRSVLVSDDGSGHLMSDNGEQTKTGTMVYTDNKHVMVYYQCSRVLEDGTCDLDHTHVDITYDTREYTEGYHLLLFKVLLHNLCVRIEEMTAVSHEVECEADPSLPSPSVAEVAGGEQGEAEEEEELAQRLQAPECSFVNIHALQQFDINKFMGTWYHLFRLKWSHHEFSAEKNLLEKQADGHVRSYGTHFLDGRCSPTTVSTYTPGKTGAEWSFGTYGGVKILFADEMFAVVYICDNVESDGSCLPGALEVEVLVRRKDVNPPQEVYNDIVATLERVCLSVEDFEKLDHTVECELSHITCNLDDIHVQDDFNIERFTGTWNVMIGLKDTERVDSGGLRITRNDHGYLISGTKAEGGECVFKGDEWHLNDVTRTLWSEDHTALARVIYTDYDHAALLYLCHQLRPDGASCAPNEETVLGLSRSFKFDDMQIRAMVDAAYATCFTLDDFEWFPRTTSCEFQRPVCKIDDMPKAESFDVSTFLGKWYAMYSMSNGNRWNNGVVQYDVLPDGKMIAHLSGSREGRCVDTQSYISHPGKTAYEWMVHIGGGLTGYVRILDTSDFGDDHAVIYQCNLMHADGSCDQNQESIVILTRRREDMSEDTRTHIRQILRDACMEPGDFVTISHNMNCPIFTYSQFECDYNSLQTQSDFDRDRFSGTWHVVARLNGTSIPDSAHLRFDFKDDTVTVSTTSYSVRRGCAPVLGRTLSISEHDPAEVRHQLDGGPTFANKVVWTDYETALIYQCTALQEDGSCPHGFERAAVLSRGSRRLTDDVIARVNEVSDQPCMQRENFQWVSFEEHCDFDPQRTDECKAENLHPAADFDHDGLEGEWHMLRTLRSDWQPVGTHIKLESITPDTFRIYYALNTGQEMEGTHCFQYFRYATCSGTPGRMHLAHGRMFEEALVVYQSADYFIYVFCPVDEDGQCDMARLDVNLYSRNKEEPAAEMIDVYNDVLTSLCLVPGDAVMPTKALEAECELPPAPSQLTCSLGDMPIRTEFNKLKVTGTWNVVAKLKGSMVRANSMLRIEQSDEVGLYDIYYRTMGPSGGCGAVSHATMRKADDGSGHVTYDDGHNGTLRVIYSDGEYAMLHDCWRTNQDGSCQLASEAVFIVSRHKKLPEGAIGRIVAPAEGTCFSRLDFEVVYQPFDCPFTKEDDYRCKVRNIPSQDNFDADKFVGTWYGHYKLYSEWDTVVYTYERDADGQLNVYYSGELDGDCTVPQRHVLSALRGRKGRYTISRKDGHFAETKIVYTDYHYAVIYNCDDVLSNGDCARDKLFIDVVSRSLDPIPDDVKERLQSALEETCHVTGDFVHTPHFVNCDPRKMLNCDVRDFPAQEDLDWKRFTGEWHVLASARHTNYEHANSRTIYIKMNNDREYTTFASFNKGGECSEMSALSYPGLNGVSADFLVHVDGHEDTSAFKRVLYTDYEHALMYMCMAMPAGGDHTACHPGKERLYILSRTHSITNSHIRAIIHAVNLPCLNEDTFVWVEREKECFHTEARGECVVEHLQVAPDFRLDSLLGTWYTRFALRDEPLLHSHHVHFEKLLDGNVKIFTTGARDGECSGQTLVSIVKKSNHPAVFLPRGSGDAIDSHLVKAVIKVLYVDAHYAVIYECDLITEDGICEPHHVHVFVLSRSKDALMSQFTIDQLTRVATLACLQPGQFVRVPQSEHCLVHRGHRFVCAWDELPDIPDFNFNRYTGQTYTVMRMRGSAWPDTSSGFIHRNHDGSYDLYFRWSRHGDCMPTASGHIEVSDTAPEWYMEVDGNIAVKSRTVWTDGSYNLAYECHRVLFDGSCVPGYDALVLFAHTPDPPPQNVLDQIRAVAEAGQCFDFDDLEYVTHELSCPPEVPTAASCQFANIPVHADFDYDRLLGTWHMLYRLRGTSDVDTARFNVTRTDEQLLQVEFAVKSHGECVSRVTTYFMDPNQPGLLHTFMGKVFAMVKVVYADSDYNNLVFYECEHTGENGLCDDNGKYVVWYSRSSEQPSEELIQTVSTLMQHYCIQPGDMLPTHFGEEDCEMSVERKHVSCSVDDLPTPEKHSNLKDTGTLYAVAKLRGSNFFNSQIARVMYDRHTDKYAYASAGERIRGGCTRTIVHPGAPAGIGHPTGGAFYPVPKFGQGMWRLLYDDYRYSVIYECFSLNEDHTCKPGMETLVVYSRKSEKVPENKIQEIFSHLPESCVTREDFEWTDLENVCPLEHFYADCRVHQVPAVENFDLHMMEGTWFSRFLFAGHQSWDSYAVRYESNGDGSMVGYYTPTRDGACLRPLHLDIEVPRGTRGVWHRRRHGVTVVVKVMYTDGDYAVMYTCDEVLEDDLCAPGQDYVDVLSRDLKPLSVAVVERIKAIISHICVQPGDLVESDHVLACEERACAVSDIHTAENYDVELMYGTWQLKGRTSQLSVERGPTSMRFIKGNQDTLRMNMARHTQSGCKNIETTFRPHHDDPATMTFDLEGVEGVMKVLHVTADALLTYECFDAEAIEGYCPEDHEEVQLWSRSAEAVAEDAMAEFLQIITSATCIDLSHSVPVSSNEECVMEEPCHFPELVAMHNYDPMEMLGSWQLVAMAVPEAVEGRDYYSTLSMEYIYTGHNSVDFLINGKQTGHEECAPARGHVTRVDGHDGDFVYEYEELHSLTKALYTDSDLFIEMECRGADAIDGAKCAPEDTSFYVWARSFVSSENLIAVAQKEIDLRTHGCYEVTLVGTQENFDCAVEVTCQLEEFVTMDHFRPRDMLGTWHLLAKQGPGDYLAYDIKIEYLSENHFKYTMNGNVPSGECLVDEGTVTHSNETPGLYHYAYQETQTLAKMLYKGRDMYIDMECKANFEDGRCSQDDVTFFVQSRDHRTSDELLAFARKEITKRTHGCYDVSDLTLRDQNECEFDGTCRFDDVISVADFNPRDLVGTWYMIGHSTPADMNVYKTYTVQYLYVHDNKLEFAINGRTKESDGACFPDRWSVTFLPDQPSVYQYSYMGTETNAKTIFMNDTYYIEMECKTAFERGVCPMNRVAFYAYSRHHQASAEINAFTMAEIVRATLGCYDVSNYHMTEQNVDCEVPMACRMNDVATSDVFSPTTLLGPWQLVARSVPEDTLFFRSYTIKYGYITSAHTEYVMSGKRGLHEHCEEERGEMMHLSDQQNTYTYAYAGKDTIAKNLYMDDKYMIEMECKSTLVDGTCPRDQAAFFVYAREHEASRVLRTKIIDAIAERTHGCFDVNVVMSEENYCAVPQTCFMDDFVTPDNFEPRLMLGTWHLVAKQLPEAQTTFHAFQIQYSYIKSHNYAYKVIGEKGSTGCNTAQGQVEYSSGLPGVYKYLRQGSETYAVVLYADADWFMEMQCRSHFVDGRCPEHQMGFFVYGREYRMSQQLKDMFRRRINERTSGCAQLRSFVFTDKTVCGFEEGCQLNQLHTIANYDLTAMLGTWEMVAKATPDLPDLYRAFTIQFYYIGHYSLKFKMNGKLRDGDECAPDEGSILFDIRNRGTYIYEYMGQRSMTKALYLDDNYYAELECKSALRLGVCPPDQAAFYIYGKRHVTDDSFRRMMLDTLISNTHGCYDLDNFVYTQMNTGCEFSDTCHLDDFVTVDNYDLHMLLGNWHLSAAQITKNTDFYRSYTIRFGHLTRDETEYRIAGKRGDSDECTEDRASMAYVDIHKGVYHYQYGQYHTTGKTLFVDDQILIEMECTTNFEDGHCDPSDVSFYVHTRQHDTSENLMRIAKEEIRKRTHDCFDLSDLHFTEATDCQIENPCYFMDFALNNMADFDIRHVLGTWKLIGQVIPEGEMFRHGFTTRVGYVSPTEAVFTLNGLYGDTGECGADPGNMQYLYRHPGMYEYHYEGETTLAKALYRDGDYFLEVECFSALVDGRCPPDQTAFYAFGRTHGMDEPLREKFVAEMTRGTEECYDLSHFRSADINECESPDPEGRATCGVSDSNEAADFSASSLNGLWYVVTFTDSIDLIWDSGIIYNQVTEDGTIEMTYTGFSNYGLDNDHCLPAYKMTLTAEEGHPARFKAFNPRRNDSSTVKVLYVSDEYLVYYECLGNQVDEFGACARDAEYVEISSRRRGINAADMAMLQRVVTSQTCVDTSSFVRMNQTRLCNLAGVTDVDPEPASCTVSEYPVQHDLDLNKLAGEWYELERTRFAGGDEFEGSVVNLTADGDSLVFEFHARRKGRCSVPFVGYTEQQGAEVADMLMHAGTPAEHNSPYQVAFPFKVLYTDYEHVALLYACVFTDDAGACRRPGEQVSLLSRAKTISHDVYTHVYDVMEKHVCVDKDDFVKADMNVPCDHCYGRAQCRMYCAAGFLEGEDGCSVCQCAPEPSLEIPAVDESESVGNSVESESESRDGDDIEDFTAVYDDEEITVQDLVESLVDDACAGRPMCMKLCGSGFVKDDQGCDTCVCNPVEGEVENMVENACGGAAMCLLYCEHGFLKDEHGCETCKCKPVLDEEFDMNDHGEDVLEDSTETYEDITIICAVPLCADVCEFGLVLDENGCETCNCQEAPVETEGEGNDIEGGGVEEDAADPNAVHAENSQPHWYDYMRNWL